jgi:transposase-like protein
MATTVKQYSIAFKRSILAEIESGEYTALEAARIHGIAFPSIYRWMKKYGSPSSQTKIVRIEMPNERNGLKELEKRNRELEKALAHAQLKIMTLEATLEVLEEKTGQRVKKKNDTPSSSASEAKEPSSARSAEH